MNTKRKWNYKVKAWNETVLVIRSERQKTKNNARACKLHDCVRENGKPGLFMHLAKLPVKRHCCCLGLRTHFGLPPKHAEAFRAKNRGHGNRVAFQIHHSCSSLPASPFPIVFFSLARKDGKRKTESGNEHDWFLNCAMTKRKQNGNETKPFIARKRNANLFLPLLYMCVHIAPAKITIVILLIKILSSARVT